MYRSLAAIQLSKRLLKSYYRLPSALFSSQSVDDSDDDFKPKSKVKDENPEEVLRFIDKVNNPKEYKKVDSAWEQSDAFYERNPDSSSLRI